MVMTGAGNARITDGMEEAIDPGRKYQLGRWVVFGKDADDEEGRNCPAIGIVPYNRAEKREPALERPTTFVSGP